MPSKVLTSWAVVEDLGLLSPYPWRTDENQHWATDYPAVKSILQYHMVSLVLVLPRIIKWDQATLEHLTVVMIMWWSHHLAVRPLLSPPLYSTYGLKRWVTATGSDLHVSHVYWGVRSYQLSECGWGAPADGALICSNNYAALPVQHKHTESHQCRATQDTSQH